jgi:integrase
MRGHVEKRKKCKRSWSIVIDYGYDQKTGKRTRECKAFRGSKKEAQAQLVERLHQVTTGGLVLPTKMTTAAFLERWLSDYCRATLTNKTYDGYSHIVHRRFIPTFGAVLLSGLTPERIQHLYADWLDHGRVDGKGGLSAATVQRYHQCLHCALDTAVKWRLVTLNVTDAVEAPRPKPCEMKILDEDELQRLLQAAKDSDHYTVFYVAAFTGMRRSEILALRWCDVDLEMSQVHVSRSLHQLPGGEFEIRTGKTPKSKRCIDLPPSAALVLRQHRQRMQAACSVLGRPMKNEDLVFQRADGRAVPPDAVTKGWIKLVRREGFHGVRFHDLRHTHATLLMKQGVHPKIVQERLGHSSIRITLDIYSHVLPGLQQDAALAFDRRLAGHLRDDTATEPISEPEQHFSLNEVHAAACDLM